jgi:type I restriction enzyme S subunit
VVEKVKSWNPHSVSDRSITYLDLSSVDNKSKLIVEPTIIGSSEAPSRARQLVSTGDVLVSTVRPNLNAVASVPPELNGATASTGFCVLRPREGQIDSRYLFHWVCTRTFISEMERLATGASYPAVSDKIVHGATIPLPTIEEQRRIASILDAADALRTKRRLVLAKLDTLTQAIFIDMFGASGKSTGVPARLSDHSTLITKGTTPTSVGFDFADSGVPFVRVQDLQGGTVRAESIELRISKETNKSLSRSILKPCDVVISIAGTIGRVAIIPDSAPDMNCNQAVALIRTSPTLAPVYLAAWLNSQDAKQQIGGSRVTGTISNLSLNSIRNLLLPIPDRMVQQRFSDRMLAVQRLIENVETSSTALNNTFASLQHRAFRGEL